VKKAISSILVLAFLFTALTGCSEKNGGGSAQTNNSDVSVQHQQSKAIHLPALAGKACLLMTMPTPCSSP
jgi:PBP1b-binding outer membrane lipoprotein LpoB